MSTRRIDASAVAHKQTQQINHNVAKTSYAVRGELYEAGQARVRDGKEVIFTNVGNPQGLGQKPLTFPRQVMSLLINPQLLDNPVLKAEFPADVVARAERYRGMLAGGSVGAYTDSRGVLGIREEIAGFINKRDFTFARPAVADDIFITNGASRAVCAVLTALLRSPTDGVLVPIPQYPLYSASVELHNGTLLPYYLDEGDDWSFSFDTIQKTIDESRDAGMTVRAIVIINPGNPTGQCLSETTLKKLAMFCIDNEIVLMADEVYQGNVYQDVRPFVSMHKVCRELPEPASSNLELVSFHSGSKGVLGECGLRGGYMHMINCFPGFKATIYKLLSVSLSPNVIGNVLVGCMVNPPVKGEPSYALYKSESDAILSSLTRRAHIMTDAFNTCEGVTCNFTEGAMYAFPRFRPSQGAIDAAAAVGKPVDVYYCLALLDATGISCVPGSGFGQEAGTFHFRTTILPEEEDMPRIIEKFKTFHANFMDQHRKNNSKL